MRFVKAVIDVFCTFRKRALDDGSWWSPRALTDDIDVTWRIQIAGWRVVYQPMAIVWILMPETLAGLWKQRLRWAEGGVRHRHGNADGCRQRRYGGE